MDCFLKLLCSVESPEKRLGSAATAANRAGFRQYRRFASKHPRRPPKHPLKPAISLFQPKDIVKTPYLVILPEARPRQGFSAANLPPLKSRDLSGITYVEIQLFKGFSAVGGPAWLYGRAKPCK